MGLKKCKTLVSYNRSISKSMEVSSQFFLFAAFSFLDDKDSLLGDSNIKKGTMFQEIKSPKYGMPSYDVWRTAWQDSE